MIAEIYVYKISLVFLWLNESKVFEKSKKTVATVCFLLIARRKASVQYTVASGVYFLYTWLGSL